MQLELQKLYAPSISTKKNYVYLFLWLFLSLSVIQIIWQPRIIPITSKALYHVLIQIPKKQLDNQLLQTLETARHTYVDTLKLTPVTPDLPHVPEEELKDWQWFEGYMYDDTPTGIRQLEAKLQQDHKDIIVQFALHTQLPLRTSYISSYGLVSMLSLLALFLFGVFYYVQDSFRAGMTRITLLHYLGGDKVKLYNGLLWRNLSHIWVYLLVIASILAAVEALKLQVTLPLTLSVIFQEWTSIFINMLVISLCFGVVITLYLFMMRFLCKNSFS